MLDRLIRIIYCLCYISLSCFEAEKNRRKLQKGVDFEFLSDDFNNIPVVWKTPEKVHSTYTPSDLNFDKLEKIEEKIEDREKIEDVTNLIIDLLFI